MLEQRGPYRTAGGAGWSLVQVQASVDVACRFDWHDTLMTRLNYPNGVYETAAYN